VKYLLLTRGGENAETRLKLLTKREREQTFELSKEDEYLWTGRWRERRESCSPVNVQRIKLKSVYNCCVQRWDIYAPIPSMRNQSIPIDINFFIDCYWKSIPIDNHMNLRHRLVIDYQYQSINRYRLALIDIDCHWLSMSSIGYPGCQLMINSLNDQKKKKLSPVLHAVYKSNFVYLHFVATNYDLSYIRTCFTD